jgi:isocitrate dehydrogenase
MYWAQALSEQKKDGELRVRFANVARQFENYESLINEELLGAQGKPVDMGGYYHPDKVKTAKAMRPSGSLNAIIGNMMIFS